MSDISPDPTLQEEDHSGDSPQEPSELSSDALVAELEAARTEAASHLEDLKRIAADFDNYRKRVAKESEATLDRATERLAVGLLPVLDSFDAALAAVGDDEDPGIYSGMVGIREQLLNALRAEGLELIPTVGEDFNPEIHEPIGAPEGVGRLVVASELRRGYRLRSKVIRAALVMLEAHQE